MSLLKDRWDGKQLVYNGVIYTCHVPYSEIITSEGFIPNSPSPDYPSTITPSIPAGTYKVACPTGGWWLLNLTDDLRRIGDYKDKIELDLLIGKGRLRKRINKNILNGTESGWYWWAKYGFYISDFAFELDRTACTGLSSHFKSEGCNTRPSEEGCFCFNGAYAVGNGNVTFKPIGFSNMDLTGWKSWLAANPVDFYYVANSELVTMLILTHVDTSDLPELVLPSLGLTAPASGYPFTSVDSEGGVLTTVSPSGQSSRITLPKLAKLLDVPDTLEYVGNGLWNKHKKVSDWIDLTGDKMMNANAVQLPLTGLRNIYSQQYPAPLAGEKCSGVKWDGSMLTPYISPFGENICTSLVNDNRLYVTANMYDTGWNPTINPSQKEVQAYFYGWKMCHTDGTSPYYKSEIPYNPSTWAEWTKDAGVTADSTGIQWTTDGIHGLVAKINTQMKPSTKYGILYYVVSTTLPANIIGLHNEIFSSYPALSNTVGYNKLIVTSKAEITSNLIYIYNQIPSDTGHTYKIRDIRIYELPSGSQIESDFNNLTADQLSAKYPFQGLCVKNWKHVTDGLGQTSVLPTASYDGYTPYKMRYQLAEPEVSEVELGIPVTAQGTNVITTENSNPKPDLSITAKCLGV